MEEREEMDGIGEVRKGKERREEGEERAQPTIRELVASLQIKAFTRGHEKHRILCNGALLFSLSLSTRTLTFPASLSAALRGRKNIKVHAAT